MNTLVIEKTEHGESLIDIFSKLANERIIFITDSNMINDKTPTDVVATMLLKSAEDPQTKITLMINSESLDIRSAFMVYDTIQLLTCPVETICSGSAIGPAALILAGGTKGMRLATANAAICVGQLDHERFRVSDMSDAKSLLDFGVKDNKSYMEAIAKATGKKTAEVMSFFERKKFFNAKQAVKYGLIDDIIKNAKK